MRGGNEIVELNISRYDRFVQCVSSVCLQYVIIYAGALGGELLREGVWAPASTPDTGIHSILCRFGKLAMLAPLVFMFFRGQKISMIDYGSYSYLLHATFV